MPQEAQNLYFHLCMNADDDGVVEAFTIMQMLGSSEDVIRNLVGRRFVKPLNEDMVSYILDWSEHNLIRADRKVNSIYKDLLLQILPEINIKEPKPRADTGVIPRQIPTGRPVDGIGKGSVGEDRIRESEKRSLRSLALEKIENPDSRELEKFLSYWEEKSEGGKKERWQMEKVFDVARRWNTWLGNKEKFGSKDKKEPMDISKLSQEQLRKLVQ